MPIIWVIMAGPWRVHALRKMSSCSVTCSPEILPPCYSKHTVFPKKFHACMVPRQQFSRPQKVTLCRIRDTLWKKTQHDTGISCPDPCIWSNESQIWCFFYGTCWWLIYHHVPSICRFFLLKRRTCPGRSRRDSLQWFDGTPSQLGETKLLLDDILP